MTDEQTDDYANFDANAFNRQVVEEFRQNNGKLSGWMEGWSLVVLTTIGAKTGRRREGPVGYFEVDGQSLVVASAMGSPKNPAWYHNIRKNPQVTVETGTETYEAIATITTGAERDALFAGVVAQDAGMGEYQEKTTRVLPVVTLRRIDAEPIAGAEPAVESAESTSDSGADRVRGMGDFLVEGHDWIRKELIELRAQVDEIIAGGADDAALERAKPSLAEQMRTHCLEFCAAVKQHHMGEDMGAFPMLAQQYPELAPELEKLGEEHKVVARLQDEIRQLVEGYVPGKSDPVQLRERLEVLASELEEHFAYEEKTVVAALNTMGPAPNIP
ncbi:nitroreductase/quinone reductase family protein [Saccharopolyspora sp. NPDC050389]|uniref:nitroreductase/quinone reductase family protein n=1 Tax=Saccharopolyspora sp. NPDC050389 TaxID=3155516 RepID=UPI0034059F61